MRISCWLFGHDWTRFEYSHTNVPYNYYESKCLRCHRVRFHVSRITH